MFFDVHQVLVFHVNKIVIKQIYEIEKNAQFIIIKVWFIKELQILFYKLYHFLRSLNMEGQESYSHAEKPSPTTSGEVSDGKNNCFIESIHTNGKNNHRQILNQLNELFKTKLTHKIEYGLQILSDLIKAGYSAKFLRYDESLRSIMNYFNGLSNELQSQPKSGNELKMLRVLSLLSQMLNENPKFNFPFNKKFIQNIFLINSEFIQVSQHKKSILKILSVIFLAISKRTKMLQEFSLFAPFKTIMLDNYALIQDPLTFHRFTKAIRHTIIHLPISLAEVKKYSLIQTMHRFLSQADMQLILQALGMPVHTQPSVPKEVKIQEQRASGMT